ncbi:DUF3297 family protein, partial [Aeromonas allosaccharophila]
MSDTSTKPALPDHLSCNPRSPHYVAACFEHPIGIRLNGKERTDVEEYCIRHSAPDLGINLPIALTQYLQNDLL